MYGNVEEPLIEFSILIVILGVSMYFVWAHGRGYWPFEERLIDEEEGEEEKRWEDAHDQKYSPRPGVASVDPFVNQNVIRHSPRDFDSEKEFAPGIGDEHPSRQKNSPSAWLRGWKGVALSPRPEAPPSSPMPDEVRSETPAT